MIADGHLPEAITELNEAVRLAPDLATAWNARAFAHLRQREYGEAIADASEAISLNPKYANARVVRDAALKASRNSGNADRDQHSTAQLVH